MQIKVSLQKPNMSKHNETTFSYNPPGDANPHLVQQSRWAKRFSSVDIKIFGEGQYCDFLNESSSLDKKVIEDVCTGEFFIIYTTLKGRGSGLTKDWLFEQPRNSYAEGSEKKFYQGSTFSGTEDSIPGEWYQRNITEGWLFGPRGVCVVSSLTEK